MNIIWHIIFGYCMGCVIYLLAENDEWLGVVLAIIAFAIFCAKPGG